MKTTTLGLGTLALTLAVLGASAGTALAYRGDPNVQGPNYSADRHEAMEEAFENNDYEAWVDLMEGRGRVTQIINEDNFAEFAEIHELMEEGKTAEAVDARRELGLGLGLGHNNGLMQRMGGAGMHRGMNR